MTYVMGHVIAVPTANKEAFRKYAASIWPLLKDYGATRLVEAWGDDVPDGKVTDFKGAVKAKPDEAVVFSWIEFPNKEVRDAFLQKSMSDPRGKEMAAAMPFDGLRMIYGGFVPIVDERGSGKTGYVDGFVVPVRSGKKDAYRDLAANVAAKFKEHGAVRVVEAWGDDVPAGKVTDYKGAVKLAGDEEVVYSWIEWPSRQVRDEAWKKMMADDSMKPEGEMPFDGQRMIWAGFAPIVDA